MIPVRRLPPTLFAVMLLGAVALACGCLGTAEGADAPDWNLTLAGDQETVLTFAEIRALPAVEGYGYSVSTVGIKYGPNTYRGVLLADLVEMAGGAGAEDLIYVSAEDGYLWVFDLPQLQGEEFFTFDENLREIPAPPLKVILAYDQDGEPLAYEEGGPLRLVVIAETPDVITEGSSWVKWVDRIEVHRR
ncbi:MAG: molybdopterin-dependent oxidoreductase [Methanomicrobiales archaeon]|jgi:DMSO/TMAO reductase YedYZ molybdopterin-dependent catalytic subunit|nr:molybdopterin-dependent oxidoreductase [Methanoculleus sp.]NLB00209.1 molybdopterin-dependent oxidoreductase [Methanomicrobiales archaeon]PKL57074.1 MAG: molybdopterin-binding oxidoreductase [Methanomicrobiales archaeon HGW-Methanomicrobiales-6]